MEQALRHTAAGIGEWAWASNGRGEPDVVMACAGDVPTLVTLAAVELLRQHLPELALRVVNVVDLMKLQSASEHPHGLCDRDFDKLFTTDKPVIFAFHGYPALVHQLVYRRTNKQFHVHGFKEEGSTTTPFDTVVRNDLDRYRLVEDVIDRVPKLASSGAQLRRRIDAWRISAKSISSTSASTVTTCRKSRTGAGDEDVWRGRLGRTSNPRRAVRDTDQLLYACWAALLRGKSTVKTHPMPG